jgi:cobalt-zinc-cadmium efflux system outer membrane protein
MQPVPFPGKLSLMEDIARYDALVAEEHLHLALLGVTKKIKIAFYSIAAVDEILGVIEMERALLGRFEEMISTRLETGGAYQQDLLKIQIERLKLDERRLEFRKRRVSLASKLNALVNREADSPVSIDSPAYRGSIVETLEELREFASSQPELRSTQYRIEQGNRSLSLARRKYFPDFTIGMSYFDIGRAPMDVPDSGRDAWNVTIGVRVPIWFGKVRDETRQQRSGIRRLEREYESVRSRILADIEDLYNQYRIAADLVSLYRDELLPRAEQALAASEGAYRTGEIDFLSLLDSERLLLGLKITLAERRAEVEIRIAELETVVGRELAGGE